MKKRFLAGFFIGIGMIAPGVSGGVFAVMYGIYDKMLAALANIFRDFKKNFTYLAPIALGGIISVLLTSRVILFFFVNYPTPTKYLFIGLVLGSLPTIWKEVNSQGFKKGHIFWFFITFVIIAGLAFLQIKGEGLIPPVSANPSIPALLFYGGIIGFGSVVPGVSASFILIYLGNAYEMLLAAISSLNFAILIPTGLGVLISIVFLIKLINFLFSRFYALTYSCILGIVLGSVVAIWPGFLWGWQAVLCLVLFIVGFLFSVKIGSLKAKNTFK